MWSQTSWFSDRIFVWYLSQSPSTWDLLFHSMLDGHFLVYDCLTLHLHESLWCKCFEFNNWPLIPVIPQLQPETSDLQTTFLELILTIHLIHWKMDCTGCPKPDLPNIFSDSIKRRNFLNHFDVKTCFLDFWGFIFETVQSIYSCAVDTKEDHASIQSYRPSGTDIQQRDRSEGGVELSLSGYGQNSADNDGSLQGMYLYVYWWIESL